MSQPTHATPRRRSRVERAVGLLLLAGGLCAVVAASPTQAQAQDPLASAEERLTQIERDITQLEARYINPRLMERQFQVETRINEGRVYYLMKDYGRASIVFVDLARNPSLRGKPAQQDALFYLADSLYLKGNPLAARRYFKELLQVGAGTYYQDTVRRLIEIASATEDYSDVTALYSAAKGRGAVSPRLSYAYARSLFRRGEASDAQQAYQVFSTVSPDAEVYAQCIYHQGVILAQEGAAMVERARAEGARKSEEGPNEAAQAKFKEAMSRFQSVLKVTGDEPDDPTLFGVMELTRMALARLYYELGDYERAINEYQYLSRTSPHFAQALFEMTWTYVKADQLKTAQRNLDILLLLAPDSALTPEAQLMRGDLLMRLDEYDDAITTYEELVKQYEPIKGKLSDVLKRQGGARAYFDALVGRNVAALDTVELPDVVEAWIQDDPQMTRNLAVARDLEVTRQDIEASQDIIRELEDVLNSRSKVDIFPELKEGWGRGLESESALIDVRRRLVEAEASSVLRSASESQRSQYASAKAERERVGKAYAQVPKNRSELQKRESQIKDQYRELERELFRIGYNIDSMRAQLVAMNTWMQDAKARGEKVSEKNLKAIRAGMQEQEETISALEREQTQLRRIIQRARAQTGINDEVAGDEQDVKRAYIKALRREHEVLAQIGQGNPVSGRVGRLMDKADAADGSVRRYFSALDRIVVEKVNSIRSQVDEEKRRVNRYVSDLDAFTGRSESLANDIALNNFRRVEDKFNDLILKADIGIIDVAWKRKEDRTNRIKELFKLKGNDLDALDKVFEGVRSTER